MLSENSGKACIYAILLLFFVDLFSLVADRDNKINDSRLWLLIYEIMQLPRQLGEAQTCSSDLDMDILMCFMKVSELINNAPC